jgi:hypothetical protein
MEESARPRLRSRPTMPQEYYSGGRCAGQASATRQRAPCAGNGPSSDVGHRET